MDYLSPQPPDSGDQPIPDCSVRDLDVSALPKELQTEKGMLSLEIIALDSFSGATHPTRGGVLMLHSHPERLVPEAYVVCSRMRGDRGRDTIENHEITGAVPQQLARLIALLEQWLQRDFRIKGATYGARRAALPMNAVREACANALFHRQYSIPGAIKVALYADRLEIFSPGHFAGPFIPESLGDGSSYIRNKVVALAARRMHLIEKRGTGLRLIMDAMNEQGLAVEFIEGAGWFKTVLHLIPITRAQTSDYPAMIMGLFETQAEITNAEVCRKLSISKATGAAALRSLMEAGRIKRVGKGPRTRYVVTGY